MYRSVSRMVHGVHVSTMLQQQVHDRLVSLGQRGMEWRATIVGALVDVCSYEERAPEFQQRSSLRELD